MPAGLEILARLGVDPPGHDIAGIRYLDARGFVDARFRGRPGRGVRRTALQAGLTAACADAGVEQFSGSFAGFGSGDGDGPVEVCLTDGRALSADVVIGADGLHSAVRAAAGLDGARPGAGARRGLRQHFRLAPWSDLVEVHWADDAEAYVTPVADDEVGIAILTDRVGGFEERLAAFPQLMRRLRGAEPASEVRGAGPFGRRSTARRRGRVLLVGDAAGYVDAITGEGLTVGWRQAEAAIHSIATGDLTGYERQWRRVVRRSTLLTSGLVSVARRGRTRRLVVPAARRLPAVFGLAVDQISRG